MSAETSPEGLIGDHEIREVVRRLARPHPSGGDVIERAAILAEGPASAPIVEWIIAHAGVPETTAPKTSRGLYGGGVSDLSGQGRPPSRYVLPAGALT